MSRRHPDADLPYRHAHPTEKCGCGRPAVIVRLLTEGEFPWCGKEQHDISEELRRAEREAVLKQAWGKGGARKRLANIAAVTLIACVLVGATDNKADAAGRCPQYEHLLAAHSMPVGTFSRIMYRESNCQPRVRSRTRDTGLLQINDINHVWLSRRLGTHVTVGWLKVPANNVRAAAALYRSFGVRPWR